jgi:dihydroneopterin aldolase
MIYKGFITGIQLKVLIGIHDFERKQAQPVLMDIEYKINNTKVSSTDNIEDTLNYQQLVDHLKKVAESSNYNLVETLAAKLLDEAEKHFTLKWIKIKLAKTSVIECASACGVEVERHYEQK